MLRNSVSVDKKVYAQQLKQKSTAGKFSQILETMRDYYLQTWFIRVASQVAGRLKT